MSTADHQRLFDRTGLELFAQGRFWPVGLAQIDMFEVRVFVPDTLMLQRHDRVALKVGHMPSFPAMVNEVAGDFVELSFLALAHPSVLAMLNSDGINDDGGKRHSRGPLGRLIAA